MRSRLSELITSVRVGHFLAVREIKRANVWTTVLISFVMTLTFLNLIVVSGILVGLIQGSEDANRIRYSGDVIISTLRQKTYIERSNEITQSLDVMPGVVAYTPRYLATARMEADYKKRTRLSDVVNGAGGIIAGINPTIEDSVTGLSRYIVEGAYLEDDDYDQILVGANLLFKYTPIDSPGVQSLRNVEAGSRVRLIVGGVTREVTVKGVVKTKAGELDQRIYMTDAQLRQLIGRSDYNVDEIAVKSDGVRDPSSIKDELIARGFDEVARIQTWSEAQPKFLKDIKATFSLLGNMIGSIGLAVASITIFIVIFVNAITRRRYIGIMKGIGISSTAIEFSYIAQSVLYAGAGMAIGAAVIFGFLQPYIATHPINFPFSDGILVATPTGTAVRALILFVTTMIAGYVPARIVVKQNTLDAILGR